MRPIRTSRSCASGSPSIAVLFLLRPCPLQYRHVVRGGGTSCTFSGLGSRVVLGASLRQQKQGDAVCCMQCAVFCCVVDYGGMTLVLSHWRDKVGLSGNEVNHLFKASGRGWEFICAHLVSGLGCRVLLAVLVGPILATSRAGGRSLFVQRNASLDSDSGTREIGWLPENPMLGQPLVHGTSIRKPKHLMNHRHRRPLKIYRGTFT
jgi:hypothetical protein